MVNSLKSLFLIVLLTLSHISTSYAGEVENRKMADAIFDFVEDHFSGYFSPMTNSVVNSDGSYYRAYPNNTFLWHKDSYIYYQLYGTGWVPAGYLSEVNQWLCQRQCIKPIDQTTETGLKFHNEILGGPNFYNVSNTYSNWYSGYSHIYDFGDYGYYLYNPRHREYVSSNWWDWEWIY